MLHTEMGHFPDGHLFDFISPFDRFHKHLIFYYPLNPTPIRFSESWNLGPWKKAGVKRDPELHKLRHSFVTNPLKAGCDIRKIQVFKRYTRLTKNMIYLHVNRETIAKLPSQWDLFNLEKVDGRDNSEAHF